MVTTRVQLWHHTEMSEEGRLVEHTESDDLILAVKSIRDLAMRRSVMAAKLRKAPPASAIGALQRLVQRGGRGDLEVTATLAALVATLEPPSALDYQTRADLYAAANEISAPEISYILLEAESPDPEEVEDTPRPVVPNGPIMSLGARKSAARTRDRVVLTHLIHDPNLQVVKVVLDNPHLVETDVLVMASKRPANSIALRIMANHKRWSQPRRIRLAVALNPNSPLPLACRLCLDLRDSDLRDISRNASSPALLRAHAGRLLDKRRLTET